MNKRQTVRVVLLSALVPLSASVAMAQEGGEAESEPGFFGRLFGFGQSDEAKERADREERDREARKKREEMEREHAQKRREMDREHAEQRREMEQERAEQHREMERERGKSARENAADRGRKKGWVDGMPPGQAKDKGKGRGQDQRGKDEREREDREYEADDAQSEASGSTPAQQQPRSAEDILRDRAKDEAVRASGVAEGSAEEELIRTGTDAAMDRAKE